jgi:tetratricopeptide (TPR) repeat protein
MAGTMSNDAILQSISADITAGRTDGVSAKLLSVSESTDDPYEILKCMSILKLVPNDGTESRIATRLVGLVDEGNALDVAKALYNLDCPYYSLEILKNVPKSDESVRLRCHCLCDLEEFESALEVYGMIGNPCINDRIMLSSILSSLGEHKRSMEEAEKLLSENPKDYDTRIAYAKSLIMGGRNKEAMKYAREGLKDKSADSNAVAAYVLRIQGNIKAAGGYASRAVQLDNNHIGGMESLGICLALKEEYDKARIVAGAINEISPGDKAAINILTYCEGH